MRLGMFGLEQAVTPAGSHTRSQGAPLTPPLAHTPDSPWDDSSTEPFGKSFLNVPDDLSTQFNTKSRRLKARNFFKQFQDRSKQAPVPKSSILINIFRGGLFPPGSSEAASIRRQRCLFQRAARHGEAGVTFAGYSPRAALAFTSRCRQE